MPCTPCSSTANPTTRHVCSSRRRRLGLDISWDVSVGMAGGSLAERHDAHQHGGARARHPDGASTVEKRSYNQGMSARRLLIVLIAYVVLDLADPAMPGAFS